MIIRAAKMEDLTSVCELYREFYAYNAELQPAYYQHAAERGAYPSGVIESKESEIFVADEDDVLLGFLHVDEMQTPPYASLMPHRYAVIMDLYVTAPVRGRGIGTLLLHAAKRWAKERGLDYLELMALSEAADAVRLYEKEAFRTVSHNMRCLL
jgi:GNAT superfamily N-acetyltransferase